MINRSHAAIILSGGDRNETFQNERPIRPHNFALGEPVEIYSAPTTQNDVSAARGTMVVVRDRGMPVTADSAREQFDFHDTIIHVSRILQGTKYGAA